MWTESRYPHQYWRTSGILSPNIPDWNSKPTHHWIAIFGLWGQLLFWIKFCELFTNRWIYPIWFSGRGLKWSGWIEYAIFMLKTLSVGRARDLNLQLFTPWSIAFLTEPTNQRLHHTYDVGYIICSQVLKEILDPLKNDPDLIEHRVWHHHSATCICITHPQWLGLFNFRRTSCTLKMPKKNYSSIYNVSSVAKENKR